SRDGYQHRSRTGSARPGDLSRPVPPAARGQADAVSHAGAAGGYVARQVGWRCLHMSWQASLAVALLSGVLVPVLLVLGRGIWHFGPIPKALSHTVRRPRYLSAVLAGSRRGDTIT